jgi:hypothetical protein
MTKQIKIIIVFFKKMSMSVFFRITLHEHAGFEVQFTILAKIWIKSEQTFGR